MPYFRSGGDMVAIAARMDDENRALADEIVAMAVEFFASMDELGSDRSHGEMHFTGHSGWYADAGGDFYSVTHSSGQPEPEVAPVMVFRHGMTASLEATRDAVRGDMERALLAAAAKVVARDRA